MKAVRIAQWGNVDVVSIDETPKPTLKENEVLVSIQAAGVNPIDWKVREGYFSSLLKDCFPFAMGWDLSGIITQATDNDKGFKVGDEVFGLIRFPAPAGTFAEFVAAPVADLCAKPRRLTHIEAAATPLVALTAWQGLFQYAKLKPNQRVLIHAAGGSVGQFSVQFAKQKGAQVFASASLDSRVTLLEYGIDHFINYHNERFEDKVSDLDVVFDPIGGQHALRSLDVIKKGGTLICLLQEDKEAITQKAQEKGITVHFMIVKPNGQQLNDIAQLLEEGLIHVPIEKTFPMSQVKKALDLVQTGHCHGKVVLTP